MGASRGPRRKAGPHPNVIAEEVAGTAGGLTPTLNLVALVTKFVEARLESVSSDEGLKQGRVRHAFAPSNLEGVEATLCSRTLHDIPAKSRPVLFSV